MRLGYHRRTDSPYLAGLRGPARVRWLNFDERNTGTVVVVRRLAARTPGQQAIYSVAAD